MTRSAPLIALAGNPNSGKSALFNALTGARQKIANYPGVTVERKSGHFAFADGRPAELVDLPGSYSLDPTSPDEEVTRNVITGLQQGERKPDAIIIRQSRQSFALRARSHRAGPAGGRGAQHDGSRGTRRSDP